VEAEFGDLLVGDNSFVFLGADGLVSTIDARRDTDDDPEPEPLP